MWVLYKSINYTNRSWEMDFFIFLKYIIIQTWEITGISRIVFAFLYIIIIIIFLDIFIIKLIFYKKKEHN
jgi:hypothetical protein